MQNSLTTQFLEIGQMIAQARARSLRLVNRELVRLYWEVGRYIHEKVKQAEWGKNVVANLAAYLQKEMPDSRGFSAQNLWRMKQLYEAYGEDEKLSPLVREIAWTQNMVILAQCGELSERSFYLKACISEQWSKRELERQIRSSLYERSQLSDHQLTTVIRETHPDAAGLFRDPYILEFLDLPHDHTEKDLRKAILRNLGRFILEAGRDFSLIGEEYRLQVGAEDFYVDLLLFHRGLQCLVAVELKIEHFRPEHLGQLSFYLEALDRDIRKPHENPSVGIILCKSKDAEVVEYALNRQLSPALISQYQTQLISKESLRQKLHELFLLTEKKEEGE